MIMTTPANGLEYDVRLSFETDKVELGQLATRNEPGDDSTRELITEEQIQDTYFSARFDTVQYGTYGGRPACILVMTFKFHASDPRSHRFRKASIQIKFTAPKTAPKTKPAFRILKFAPETAVGELTSSRITSTRDLTADLTIGNSLVSATVSPSLSNTIESVKSQRAIIQGTERGNPPTRLVWSIVENSHAPDGIPGIPARIRTAVIVGLDAEKSPFSASFNVDASVGWWLDPRRWPLTSRKDDPVLFDPSRPLLRNYQEFGPALDAVNLIELAEFGTLAPEKKTSVAVQGDDQRVV